MSRSEWRQVWGWGPVRIDGIKADGEKLAWKAGIADRFNSLDPVTLDDLIEMYRARYDGLEAARDSVNGRANNLLVFVGVIAAAATLLGSSLERAPEPIAVGLVLFGGLLLLFAFGTAFLAVRAQLVAYWDAPWIEVEDVVGGHALRVRRATEMYVAAHQNRLRLQAPVVLLAHAQRMARITLALVLAVAVLSVAGALYRRPAPAVTGGSPISVPTAAPTSSSAPVPSGTMTGAPTTGTSAPTGAPAANSTPRAPAASSRPSPS
jgi:hypothetical protein